MTGCNGTRNKHLTEVQNNLLPTDSRILTSKEAGQLPIVTKIGLLKTVAAHGRERRLELKAT